MAQRKMTSAEVAKLGGVPLDEADSPVRKISSAEAEKLGAQPFVPDSPLEGIPKEPVTPEADWLEPRSASGTALRSFGKGGSLNFSDEIGGALGVVDELGRRGSTSLGATSPYSVPVENESLSLKDALIARFRRERDDSRSELATGVLARERG